ncbi:MAG TPA: hypothetical protein VKU02_28115 [Gemmataceae bacterium]|nr:hypothetical protein [Gemmataceae bacterium]
MYPHRIRLRGPWQCEPLARAVRHADGPFEVVPQPSPPFTMSLPCRWSEGGLGDFVGRVRFRRRFGRPRRLDPHEAVWLTFAGVETNARVTLNGQLLGQQNQALQSFEFVVTELIRERNELVVEVEALSGNRGLWGEVALEIRAPAFLRSVRAWRAAANGEFRMHIYGEVVGISDSPLDLYVLMDRGTLAYQTIQPTAAGQAFELVCTDPEPAQNRELRIELVHGAVVWYTAACALEKA